MTEEVFVSVRREPTDARVRSNSVVKSLDIAKYGIFCGASRSEIIKVDTLTFDTGEEVFSDGNVIGVAFAGHTLLDTVFFQGLSKGDGGILNPTV